MFEMYRKKGKKGKNPGKTEPVVEETLGDVYHYRHEMGGEERRMREIHQNQYGKKQPEEPMLDLYDPDANDKGFPVSPRRTEISG